MDNRERLEKFGLYDSRFEHSSCGVGFVCDIKGRKSNEIIHLGLEALKRLLHRGATGADPKTGDGAGILIQIPHEFFKKVTQEIEIELPDFGKYGTGLVFLPPDEKERQFCKDVFSKIIKEGGQTILGWRRVPVDDSDIGKTARETQPVIEQVFVGGETSIGGLTSKELDFEKRLYIIRKRIENTIRASKLKQKPCFYITNISSRTFSYKGLLMSTQLERFFLDLQDSSLKSALCLIHARYSTNTFPTWDLAQPFRFLAHNGEINTLRGNINWMHSRQGLLESSLFGKGLKKILPIIVPGGSDSATIDNVLELLVLGGRSIAHSMMMLIPEAWQDNPHIDEARKYFYEYHACLMEPWDGPASIAFTDGRFIGATLDRNGLRPSRYVLTKDNRIVMASEVGVLDIAPENILINGRLQPGKMFLVDTYEGRIIDDKELKQNISRQRPYKIWVKKNLKRFEELPQIKIKVKTLEEEPIVLQKAFGYSREDLKVLIKPLVEEAYEPTGSMGDDTPLAVLSKKHRLLFDYFKQLFAQVTNPAIDPIREELVMTLETYLGKELNLLDETAQHCRRLKVRHPILTDEELEKIKRINNQYFKTKSISILFAANPVRNLKRETEYFMRNSSKISIGAKEAKISFKRALKRICREAEKAIKEGFSFILLSDRGVNQSSAAIPSLLAVGGVHHHLVRKKLRTQVSIIVESGEPKEVAHFAILFGYGADCINPYLAYETIKKMVAQNGLNLDLKTAQKNYLKALEKGLLKILSKMGISTLQSYRGAQIFEALGLNKEVIAKCFTGTVSRIEGIGLDLIAQDVIVRHREAFSERDIGISQLPSGGLYQWKKDGEEHLWNPDTVFLVQQAVRNNDYKKYQEFAKIINEQRGHLCTLRGLLKFSAKGGSASGGKKIEPLPIEEVEPAANIIKRFCSGAMSFGSISKEAHETIAICMNRLGARSNSGEGGEDPIRFIPLPNGDSLCSAVKQVASGRFGVTINYLTNAQELQIKIAQGAKPGEGGQLPGHKVSVTIAKTRYTTPGVTLISPPPHHDIYSIEDLAQLIFDLKNANPNARISVKLVSEIGVGTIAAGVAKGHADMILISGGDGGTGASPLSSIKHAGLPWEIGLSETHQILVWQDLRSRVRLQTDGQMRTGRDVVIAAILGAEEYGFCTAALVVIGCVMLRHCHLNNCSVGVATQEECLRKRFTGRPEFLQNYFYFVAEEARSIMAQLGVRRMEELIGRTEFLEVNKTILSQKAKGIDFSKILYKPKVPESVGVYCIKKQEHGVDKVLDLRLIELAKSALEKKEPLNLELSIQNKDRTTGAMLSGEVTRRYGEGALPEDTIHFKFKGTAGQSFGAFLARGITLELEGDANDYVGKGLSGGKLIIYPPKRATFLPEENIIIGNTTFYGATSGEAYIRGIAGERFCIRNSGLFAVAEGVGDHGCEYMTGGRVVILGKTGRNFAAGMSGGIAYIYDIGRKFASRCNMSMVEFDIIDEEDEFIIHELLSKHFKYTGSLPAKNVLDNYKLELKYFVKVLPLEYKRVLEGRILEEKLELVEVSDG